MKVGFIYYIKNCKNNYVYIGQTKNSIKCRFNQHISNAKLRNKNNKFYNAISKYGAENFKIYILFKTDIEDLDRLEQIAISLFKPEYNTSDGGKSTRGFLGKTLSASHLEALQKHKFYTVYKYNMKGEYIESFDSLQDARCSMGDCNKYKSISHCINNKQKSAFGFIWSKIKKYNLEYESNQGCPRKVVQKTSTGKILKIWNSGMEAEKIGGFQSSKISLVCNNIRKKHKKYIWEFYEK